MRTFLSEWGYPSPGTTTGYKINDGDQSLYASIVQVGEIFGSLSAGFVGDRFGRKGSMHFAITLVTIGTVLQLILAGSKALLTVGRLILGAGVGVISNCQSFAFFPDMASSRTDLPCRASRPFLP
jgi:SP family sugar:H+ symporter-like MFS transporter